MAPILSPVWYVRKNGWVQGPFTGSLVRRMYATSWVGATDRVAQTPAGPWQELRQFPELVNENAGETQPCVTDRWEVAAPLLPSGQPVEFGMLQMFAAAGRLTPKDLVRRFPDGVWQRAGHTRGIFGGRRFCCTACGASLGDCTRACQSCGAIQPGYEPSLATAALVCSILGLAWYWIAIITVTALAIQQATVSGIALDEHFPQAYLLTLMPSFWLSIVALWFGAWAYEAVRTGRSSPADAETVALGSKLGWATLALLLLTFVAVVAFSLPFFRMVT